ncbi:MAG: hypothetical protein ABJN34_07260 [Litoreibacter sp.]|uniref:hypothetical protein n=1 Tax=Litoreibacter sp. TaxID=1969459 RepID=UPI0032984FAB
MQDILYTHRFKTVLQHSVVELGLTLSMDDEGSDISLAKNEALIRETASSLGIKVNLERAGSTTTAVFYR